MAPHRNILIVDDESLFRTALALALVDDGYHVTAVANGSAALDAVATSSPNLILLDVNMPVMDGPTFLRRYRQLDSGQTPVIICSTQPCEARLADLDVAAHLTKPCDIDLVFDSIRQHIGGQDVGGRKRASWKHAAWRHRSTSSSLILAVTRKDDQLADRG